MAEVTIAVVPQDRFAGHLPRCSPRAEPCTDSWQFIEISV